MSQVCQHLIFIAVNRVAFLMSEAVSDSRGTYSGLDSVSDAGSVLISSRYEFCSF